MFQKDFDEILSTEIISLTGGLIAGLLLSFATDKLEIIPALFILLPGFLEMRGNISGSMASRITSGLYVGVLKYGHNKKAIITGNVIAAFLLAIVVSLFLGLLAFYISGEVFGVVNPNIILVSLTAAILSNVIEIPLTVFTTNWLFKRGHDPNNIMGPYVTTTGDIVSIVALLIAITVIA